MAVECAGWRAVADLEQCVVQRSVDKGNRTVADLTMGIRPYQS